MRHRPERVPPVAVVESRAGQGHGLLQGGCAAVAPGQLLDRVQAPHRQLGVPGPARDADQPRRPLQFLHEAAGAGAELVPRLADPVGSGDGALGLRQEGDPRQRVPDRGVEQDPPGGQLVEGGQRLDRPRVVAEAHVRRRRDRHRQLDPDGAPAPVRDRHRTRRALQGVVAAPVLQVQQRVQPCDDRFERVQTGHVHQGLHPGQHRQRLAGNVRVGQLLHQEDLGEQHPDGRLLLRVLQSQVVAQQSRDQLSAVPLPVGFDAQSHYPRRPGEVIDMTTVGVLPRVPGRIVHEGQEHQVGQGVIESRVIALQLLDQLPRDRQGGRELAPHHPETDSLQALERRRHDGFGSMRGQQVEEVAHGHRQRDPRPCSVVSTRFRGKPVVPRKW
ncbi:MAG: hypothetical protein AVDCRST_MAG66-4393 [uncultured Pseudonocardia sp.]|uniref:Uncharacterized protein n=1 Tax=uncultured Pseudonocardia sp. TaxID=211455 RepID=A0A6J4QN31_9PSEU|nr:MAG: hypothetical protein AVDCRST_MAG66-4393 [uncultured Pseudonocardia sp.]